MLHVLCFERLNFKHEQDSTEIIVIQIDVMIKIIILLSPRCSVIHTIMVDVVHIVIFIVDKLSCGEHKCEEPCHRGNCPACWRVSFDELRCHCGTEVIYPPVPCGTQAPACSRPCTRTMPCGHKVGCLSYSLA